jgi:hypothetical protein
MTSVKYVLVCIILLGVAVCRAVSILIPMDANQNNHLKAYGIAYFVLQKGLAVDWLLNYRGGSFMVDYSSFIVDECTVRGVSFEVISDINTNAILTEISNPEVNMNVVKMERAPRIAVYSPKNEFIMDETDAVILVLDYAEIPYDIIYDEEVLNNYLLKYDWLHLHHEDFTGQGGRSRWRESSRIEIKTQEALAQRLGYHKLSEMKLAVAHKIKDYTLGGGYLFAMCSAAETFDIALAAEGTDISESIYDGDEPDPYAQEKLDYEKSLAFENFTLEPGDSRKFSDINTGRPGYYDQGKPYFDLFTFSAKWDIIPTLLTQDHTNAIREFTGQTTAFDKRLIKPTALILAENTGTNRVRYIYGELGKGHWTYYSGHDPESSPGRGRIPTDLNLYPHSPGYRLILNNVLFPSAQKKKQKT